MFGWLLGKKKAKEYTFDLPLRQDAYYSGDTIKFNISIDKESTVVLFIYDKRGTWLNLIYTIDKYYFVTNRDYDSNVYMYGYADKGITNLTDSDKETLEINWLLPENFPPGEYIIKASVFSKNIQKTFTGRLTIYAKGRFYGKPGINLVQGNHFDKLRISY